MRPDNADNAVSTGVNILGKAVESHKNACAEGSGSHERPTATADKHADVLCDMNEVGRNRETVSASRPGTFVRHVSSSQPADSQDPNTANAGNQQDAGRISGLRRASTIIFSVDSDTVPCAPPAVGSSLRLLVFTGPSLRAVLQCGSISPQQQKVPS